MVDLKEYRATKTRVSDQMIVRELRIPKDVLHDIMLHSQYAHYDLNAWIVLLQQRPSAMPEVLKSHLVAQEFDLTGRILIQTGEVVTIAQPVTHHDIANRMLGRS